MEQGDLRTPPSAEDRERLLTYLRVTYAGVFDESAVQRHLDDYVGFTFVDQVLPFVTGRLQAGARLLDIGSGFGSFVLAARQAGLDAQGVEIAPFEVEYARRRLASARPNDRGEEVFLLGDILTLQNPWGTFDAVTAWNVLEHIPDYRRVLGACHRLLRPAGWLWVICPNYFAFRHEAHYQVPWRPLLTRAQAIARLRRFGKDPAYFERGIFQRTNWGVLRGLRRAGFTLRDIHGCLHMDLRFTNLRTAARHFRYFADFYNPLRDSVVLSAVRGT